MFWMELFQMAEITAEEVKCGCIIAIRQGKWYLISIFIFIFTNEAVSFSSMLQLTKYMFKPI